MNSSILKWFGKWYFYKSRLNCEINFVLFACLCNLSIIRRLRFYQHSGSFPGRGCHNSWSHKPTLSHEIKTSLTDCATKMVDIPLFASVRGNNLIWIKHYKSTNALKSNHLIKIFSEPDWVPSTSEWALTQRHSNLQSGIHEGKLNKYNVEHNFLLKLIIIIWPQDESNYFHFISWRKIYDSAQLKSLWTVHILSCSCISYFFLWFVQLSHLPFRRKYTTWLSCFPENFNGHKNNVCVYFKFSGKIQHKSWYLTF